MDGSVSRSSGQPSRRRRALRLCVAIAACTPACAAPAAAGAEAPRLPSVGGSLTIGIPWGLYEQRGSEAPDNIGIVGAPMPFVMNLMSNGENRLFILIQHRLPGGPYCAETPAQLEDLSVELTSAAGDPTIPGPEYEQIYVWTPAEAGEYTLCAYLDSAAANHPAATNFVKLTADPAPGALSFAVAPEAEDSERSTVKVEGTAVVPSELTASVQEQGLPCSLPEDGRLAGERLTEPPGGSVAGSSPDALGPGPFTTSYTFAASKPGTYEVCAYLTPAPTEEMYFGRPYEVGSVDFSVQEPPAAAPGQRVTGPTAPEAPPTLSGVSMSNRRFRVAPGRTHGVRRAPVGTTFRFAVSAPATVTIAIARLLPGVLRGGVCAPLRAAAVTAHARRCNRSVAVGSIVRALAAGGEGLSPFSGVVGHSELAAGSYSAEVTAHNADGRSGSASLRFSVTP